MRFGIVYKVINSINGKIYVGQTTEPLSSRMSKHKYRGKDTSIFHKALVKYGMVNFVWVTLYECSSKEEMDKMEKLSIKEYNSHYKDGHGYNMTYGGEGSIGFKHTEETKKKLSEMRMGKPSKLKGRKVGPMSLERRIKISEANKGRKITEETKKKLSVSNTGKKHSNETILKLKNRLFSKETREKMSIARRGAIPWNKGKRIKPSEVWLKTQESSHAKTYGITKEGKTFLITNLAKWCRENNINSSGLCSALKKNKAYKKKGIIIKLVTSTKGDSNNDQKFNE